MILNLLPLGMVAIIFSSVSCHHVAAKNIQPVLIWLLFSTLSQIGMQQPSNMQGRGEYKGVYVCMCVCHVCACACVWGI